MEEAFGLWFIVGALLVFFMQAGFAMVEAGFTRAKNAGNIVMKNTLDFSIGAVVFLLVGYGLLSGANGNLFIGTPDLSWIGGFGDFDWSDFFFQLVFCATATTIVSGAMAERTKFSSYLVVTLVICALIYPIETHWVWGGGWLAELGFLDWAGSGVIHMVGGIIAIMGAAFLGPRIGKYDANGKSNAIPGHSITLGALGVFILWFGWYGFNGAAGGSVDEVAAIFCTTTLSAVAAAIAAMVASWVMGGKPDVTYTLNGALAGLVGITAGCAYVDAVGALVIGLVCGVAVVVACEFIDKVLHIDDPVGASGVHGVCGLLGTVMTGLFAVDGGLFYGGGLELLGVQCLGVLAIAAWTVVTAGITLAAVKATMGLRVTASEEVEGLDVTEHGLTSAYADFLPVVPSAASAGGEDVDVEGLVPVALEHGALTRVSIVCNQSEFVKLKDTLAKIGVTGMTVSNVMGCGIQKGKVGSYRGVKTDVNLLPKLQVDVVVSEVDPGLVVAAAQRALHTGAAGDGKVFVSNVQDVLRISTGQTGTAALDMTTEVRDAR
jgi:Amt family ammonium transporter